MAVSDLGVHPARALLLPVTGLGIISSSIGLVIFGTRLGNPVLRTTALIGIVICLVALTIAIITTTLVNHAINH